MIKVEHIETFGWEAALRGMRNPLDSWEKADSKIIPGFEPNIGPNDKSLMRRLIGAGSNDHCKFRRMLVIYCDITAPLYWWKEFDTYKVGTVSNSCSTMHTIMRREFTGDMFSWEDVFVSQQTLNEILADLNAMRFVYLKAKEDRDDEIAGQYWRNLIQELPSAWNQKRTVMLNYEVMANIYRARKNHKLKEWHDFIDAIASKVPYPWIFTGQVEK